MFRAFLKWTALFFLVVESLGLIASVLELCLRLAHRSEVLSPPSWEETALELILRLAIVGFILSAYLHLKNIARLPLTVTRQSALLITRAVQSVLLAAIALFALVAEKITGSTGQAPLLLTWSLSALALVTVISNLILRRRLLFGAYEVLRRDRYDSKGLGRWQMITILNLVQAMSIGLYGFFLRMMGNARTVEWSFFFVSVVLLLFWTPRLDDGTSSPVNPISNHEERSV